MNMRAQIDEPSSAETVGDGETLGMKVSAQRRIEEAVEHGAHLLPAQRPLDGFVHHNTLHHFEDMSFRDAVREAGETFGAEPYLSEAAFREAWDTGRIRTVDLNAVLEAEVPETALVLDNRTLTERELVRALLRAMPEQDVGHSLDWRMRETQELQVFPALLPREGRERLNAQGPAPIVLSNLWAAARRACPRQEVSRVPARRIKEVVLSREGVDIDDWVHPMLIRWCGAFLDPALSYWPMMEQKDGFYLTMLRHFAQPGGLARRWSRSVGPLTRELLEKGLSPVESIQRSLERMGWPESEWATVIEQTLLAMPGWPGMFVQLGLRPDLAPEPPPPTDLVDYVAIRLLFDEAAARDALKCASGPLFESVPLFSVKPTQDHGWRLFCAARLLGLTPLALAEGPGLTSLLECLDRYDEVNRRGLWQLAYERRYRHQILDSVLAHWRRIEHMVERKPRAQLVCCIDDREESLRRYLEELDPAYETFGAAGFYGVAMYYRALGEPHQTPLCPMNTIPEHFVEEVAIDAEDWEATRSRSSMLGGTAERFNIASNTLFRGGLVSLWGWSTLIPLATRILAPRLHGRLTARSKSVPTRLALEASNPPIFYKGWQVGYTPAEMIDIVRTYLEFMGLTRNFAEVVVFLGHGSRSLNNPQKAAYDCGACGGGQGGANGRAFALMANRADVREGLVKFGIAIPESTWFVGGNHNTCDDNIVYFDEDLIPRHLDEVFKIVKKDLDEARKRDAHERCRRFLSAPLDMSFDEALEHVENRAEDLAQARPECGHGTNALCFVGRRHWNRGLYLDRRVFLTSYDPEIDPDGDILERLLASVGPVGAGINLEYYFSFIDPVKYGSNTKLPHNVTGFIGVMDGHSSDLRTGLPWQMVEIHEPIRLLNVVEARPERLLAILERQPGLKQLIVNRWIHVAAFDPGTHQMWFFEKDGFVLYQPDSTCLPEAQTSTDWYRGRRDHLGPASILTGLPGGESI